MKKFILKHSNKQNPFSSRKLEKSLIKAGADISLAKEITHNIENELTISNTNDIHNYVFGYLKKKNRSVAARYNIKRAIAELGPTGFPFEEFVGELLRHKGYVVEVGVVIKGHCVNHEIDVVAEKDNKHFIIECKFHNKYWIKSHVQTSLYVKARFDDVERGILEKNRYDKRFHQAWIITNTKLTTQALNYAKCAGLNVISWDYPKGGSLPDIIDEFSLHPITALTTIKQKQKKALIEKGVVLCRDIATNISFLKEVGLNNNKIKSVLKESHNICRL